MNAVLLKAASADGDRIPIDDNWSLGWDDRQWSLQRFGGIRKDGPEAGEAKWKAVAFVSSTRDVLARVMRDRKVPDGAALKVLATLPHSFADFRAGNVGLARSDHVRGAGVPAHDAERANGVLSALRSMRMVGQVWPVVKTDPSPAIFGLLVPRAYALAELNFINPRLALSDGELARMLKDRRILDWGAPLPHWEKLQRRGRARR
jgi:hypothetical protein